MRSIENYQRLLDLYPSPVNGIALCQGNFTLMTDDLPGAIRHFGKQGKIFFVHFRDVRGTPEKFVETFHDEGKTDMLACMQAYRDIGFEGVLPARPRADDGRRQQRQPGLLVHRPPVRHRLHQGPARGGLRQQGRGLGKAAVTARRSTDGTQMRR